MLLSSASEINMTLPNNIILVTRWYHSVLSKLAKMSTSAKIISWLTWMFFIVKCQIITYFPVFMPIAFLDLLLENNAQLSVHRTVPKSEQSINFEDFTPWSLYCCYMAPCNIDAWFWLFFQSVHLQVLINLPNLQSEAIFCH